MRSHLVHFWPVFSLLFSLYLIGVSASSCQLVLYFSLCCQLCLIYKLLLTVNVEEISNSGLLSKQDSSLLEFKNRNV